MKFEVKLRMENFDGEVFQITDSKESKDLVSFIDSFEFKDLKDLPEDPPDHFNEHNITLLRFEVRRV